MPRRREVAKRKVLPDPKFGDRIVAKFMNTVMMSGKKSTAEKIVYSAFDLIGEKGTGEQPLNLFKKALEGVKPLVEVKSRRVGGAVPRGCWRLPRADCPARQHHQPRPQRHFGSFDHHQFDGGR